MTQSDIINQLAEKAGLKKTDVKGFFDNLADLATSEVKKSGEFTLPGFGKFVKTKRKAREGRNPATGETIKIAAKTTVKFRASKSLKDAVAAGK
ncbi:MAG: HU family DNA-binding protein [Pyrinomonadaceae bacterium]